jgi:hypothetical protein
VTVSVPGENFGKAAVKNSRTSVVEFPGAAKKKQNKAVSGDENGKLKSCLQAP